MQASINNQIYHDLGERWYQAYDDPVALLRAQSKLLIPWVHSEISQNKAQSGPIIELGCGGGFITNGLSQYGHDVTGLDISQESLDIAKKYDRSRSVSYVQGDVNACPFPDQSFSHVISFDVLEHIERPQNLVKEAFRLLKPGGRFFFHTFNRNALAHLVVIKFVEWFVRNTPQHMHVIDLFIKPEELKTWCYECGFDHIEFFGVRLSFRTLFAWSVLTRTVPRHLAFKWTEDLSLSYCGFVVKPS